MNCKKFQDRLPAFTSRQLSTESRLQCETHITDCVECLDLWLSHCSNEFSLEPKNNEELVSAILQSTNSKTCNEAEDLLVDYIDETLELASSEILSIHLANCTSCKKTALTLLQLREDLPQIGLREPPADLLETVLGQTLPWPKRVIRKISKADFGFSNLIVRPRFSMEASFLGTILWLALFGLPNNISAWAATEQYSFNPDFLSMTQVEDSISTFQENLETNVSRLQPLVVVRFSTLGNFSAQLIEKGITNTRQRSNKLWQSFAEVLPLNLTDNPINE